MRKLLLLALLLYDVVVGSKINALDSEYEEIENKRHSLDDKRQSLTEDRRSWRKKTLTKADDNSDETYKKTNRNEYNHYHKHETEKTERIIPVRNRKRSYVDVESLAGNFDKDLDGLQKYSKTSSIEKDVNKKASLAMSCNREHEKYEACFAGCAAVSCDNPRDRLRPCYPFCEPGCVCVSPRVRDDRTHKCVLPEECTKGLKGIPDLGMNEELRSR